MTIRKSFEFELVLKDTETVFADGFSKGGLVKTTYTFNAPDDFESNTRFKYDLMRHMDEFIKSNITVLVKEVADA